MVRYVYYNPGTMQIEAEFDTPELSVQANWGAKGLKRGVQPFNMNATRDHKIVVIRADERILSLMPSINPIQPPPPIE